MDEQHSRSQRKFGAAPYCTCTFLNEDSLICMMISVDDNAVEKSKVKTKAGEPAKSKAKVSHCEGMKAIVDAFKKSDSTLEHFCTDQSSDGSADAEQYFRSVWKNYKPSYDIWHKVKEFDGLWKTLCTKRECLRGVFISSNVRILLF